MQMFLQEFLKQSSHCWALWFEYCSKRLPGKEVPTGTTAARALRSFLNGETLKPFPLMRLVWRKFGITTMTYDRVGEGKVSVSDIGAGLFYREHMIHMFIGNAPKRRQLSIAAHELGHVLYGCFCEISQPTQVWNHLNRSEAAERFCWDFALELCCPAHLRMRWNRDYVKDLLSHGTELPSLGGAKDVVVFESLCLLAAASGVSIRLIIKALDRHPLLDDEEVGIVVIRNVANQWTGTQKALRIWQYARPSWGHVVFNQSAIKQGFSGILEVFENVPNRVTVQMAEKLNVWVRSVGVDKKWERYVLSSICHYTPVDVRNEGRYVIAIWAWAKSEMEA